MQIVRLKIFSIVFFSLFWSALFSQNATTPQLATAPYPTIQNIGVEWEIQGDDNVNCTATVRFRESGSSAWTAGMPLFRVPAGSNQGFSWTNKLSGSLFDLTQNTAYDIELTLSDPDGGSAVCTVTATTRPEPGPASNATVISVTPATFSANASSAQPGDILLLAPGTYSGFTFGKDGAQNQPIVIRGSAQEDVIVNGDVRLDNRAYVHVESLTVNGKIKFNSADYIAVQRCSVVTTEHGIIAYNGCIGCYIADNVVIGSTIWADSTLGASGDNLGEGICLTGPGNVICHNRVKGFRDCISFLEDAGAVNQACMDVYGNDIYVGADDGIEADFAMGNCRIMRNRLTNCFVGLSSQPSLGGPTYFIRNVMYNIVYSPFKLHRGSIGDVALHNTSVKCGDALACYSGDAWSYTYFRNNLFIGGEGGGTYGGYSNGSGRVAQLRQADATCSYDYDAFGSINTGTFTGRIGSNSFSSLSEMRANTTEAHGVQVDMSVFNAPVSFPGSGPYPERPVADLRIKAGTPPVDAGLVIKNINDAYQGTAPDMGAYETGDELPIYGPRPKGMHTEFSRSLVSTSGVLKAFPNPFNERVVITIDCTAEGQNMNLRIYNINGRLTADLSGSQDLKTPSPRYIWQAADYPAGVYIVKLDAGNRIYIRRLLLFR
jgi:hypothetical protein